MGKALGLTGNAAGTGAPSPGNPSIVSVPVPIDTTDGGGKQLKQITVLYLPPSPLGTFQGGQYWLDAPDSSGMLPVADGVSPGAAADGNTAATGTFQPTLIGDFAYDPNNLAIVFTVDAPAVSELARVYLTPGAKGSTVLPIQHGQHGESPNYQFRLDPPAPIGVGREKAPLVTNAVQSPVPAGWDANPHIGSVASGDQFWEDSVSWAWPAADQNLATLGGINFVLDDGITQKYLGNIAYNPNITSFVIPHQAVRTGTVAYKLWLISYSVDAQNNTLIAGVTPSVSFTVTRVVGAAGVENCALVLSDGVNAFVTATPVAGADGSSLLQVNGFWAAPADPKFAGAEIVCKKLDGKFYSVAQGRLSPLTNDISNPATVQSWDFYLRSIDINGLRNTIVDGVTPKVTISVGNASGQLDLSKVKSGSFASGQFTVVSGAFTVTALAATIVNTGILQVGGGGSKVSQVKIFDTLNSLIGWIGDDTGVSGFVGGWFKQLRIGGTSPGTAQVVADSSGNVTISGSLVVGAVGSANSVPATGVTAGTFGGGVIYAGTINCSQLNAGTISVAITLTSPTITVTGGSISVHINATDFIKVSDSSITAFAQMTGSSFVVGSNSATVTMDSAGNVTCGDVAHDVVTMNTNGIKGTTGSSPVNMFSLDMLSGFGNLSLMNTAGAIKAQLFASSIPALYLGGNQVVMSRQTDPGAPSFATVADAQTWCGNLRTQLRNHGLI